VTPTAWRLRKASDQSRSMAVNRIPLLSWNDQTVTQEQERQCCLLFSSLSATRRIEGQVIASHSASAFDALSPGCATPCISFLRIAAMAFTRDYASTDCRGHSVNLDQSVIQQSWQYRYALAVIGVFVATALRFWLSGLLHPQPFPTYFLAVFMVAVMAGARPVLLATLLSGASAVCFFMEPFGAFKLIPTSELIRLSTFTAIGLGIAALTEAMGRARQTAINAPIKLAEA
jgi:hypothetical protein